MGCFQIVCIVVRSRASDQITKITEFSTTTVNGLILTMTWLLDADISYYAEKRNTGNKIYNKL